MMFVQILEVVVSKLLYVSFADWIRLELLLMSLVMTSSRSAVPIKEENPLNKFVKDCKNKNGTNSS